MLSFEKPTNAFLRAPVDPTYICCCDLMCMGMCPRAAVCDKECDLEEVRSKIRYLTVFKNPKYMDYSTAQFQKEYKEIHALALY